MIADDVLELIEAVAKSSHIVSISCSAALEFVSAYRERDRLRDILAEWRESQCAMPSLGVALHMPQHAKEASARHGVALAAINGEADRIIREQKQEVEDAR